MNEVPGDPGAAAVQLFYSQDIDDNSENNEAEYIYRRIKVLNEKGNKYADVEVIVPTGFKLQDLKARTIHPDGKIVEFPGKPFDKVIVRGHGIKYSGKSFTFPEVTPGSIIEYMYKLDYPPNLIPYHEWEVQHDLYTVKESFRIRLFTGQIRDVEGGAGVSLAYNLPKGVQPKSKGDSFELQVENVPAFVPEPYMPPEQQYKYHVTFFYGGKEVNSLEKFWLGAGRKWSESAEDFIGNRKEVKEAATQAVSGVTEPEAQLRKLYARAQQVRNLSYERERTVDEQKKENIRSNQNAADVLSHGYGDREDITYLFVALARAAGFEAWPVKTGNRAARIFQKTVLDSSQLEGQAALVLLNGREVYLDPGTPFCSFGSLRWIRTSSEGLKLDHANSSFIKMPGAPADQASIEKTANVTLDADGTLKGELLVIYGGTQALERRLDALNTDDAGRKKYLEDEIKSWLPAGASVTLKEAKNWDGSDLPLQAKFDVQVPGYGSITGKRVMVPVYLFKTARREAFEHEQRRFPLYFQFAAQESDHVNISIPSGFSIEAVPLVQTAELPYAAYQSSVRFTGGKLSTERTLQLNVVSLSVEKYPELKGFFGKVQAGDEQQAVFQGGIVSAQKGN